MYINKKTNIEKQAGFTMIEVIAVIIIIGIIAAVAVSKIASTRDYHVAAEADILKMNLRYAQLRSLGDDKHWGISFSGSSYTLLRDGNTAPYNLPNENSSVHTLPSGINVSGDTVIFNEWGTPVDPSGSALTNSINIILGEKTITVIKNTGFIE